MGKTGIASIHTMHTLWVSTLSFQVLAEVNGPAKADNSKIVIGNSYVALDCKARSGSGVVFHKIPCDEETQKLWLIALKLAKQPNLKHACECRNYFLEGDYYPNYKMQSELTGRCDRNVFSFS